MITGHCLLDAHKFCSDVKGPHLLDPCGCKCHISVETLLYCKSCGELADYYSVETRHTAGFRLLNFDDKGIEVDGIPSWSEDISELAWRLVCSCGIEWDFDPNELEIGYV